MKWIIPFISLVLFTCNTFAQTPEKMSYQAVIRDNNNELVTNSTVNLKISVRQGSPEGSVAYQENHQTNTNANGLVSLQVGKGNQEVGEFSGIDWSKGPYFIETQLDVKNTQNFSVTGVSEMMSVPYALHAKTADHFTGSGEEPAFENWDKNAADDFSGNYADLKNIPSIYTKNQVDSLVVNLDGGDGVVQSLILEGKKLSISGGNTISFENWDASNDFSGDYSDLKNAPELFSGKFTELTEVPDLYTKNQVDSLVVNLDGGDGVVQSLKLEGKNLSISGGNTISFENWDASNDFSGSFKDLTEVPDLYTKNQVDSLVVNLDGGDGVVQSLNLEGEKLSISGGNSISFENWDTNASDDFSGSFKDLTEVPDLYTRNQVDSLVVNLDGADGVVQSLDLEGKKLSITGGNSISFENWDTDTSDDFSGSFKDLTEVPNLYTKNQVDSLVVNLDGGDGVVQSLNLEGEKLSISGGNYISFENWDTDASDDFSGDYSDLKNIPSIYTKNQVDSLVVNLDGGDGVVQSLDLEGKELSITGGNTISFENWDTDASDDFSGDYSDLKNPPDLFSGKFNDLSEIPDLYTKNQVDSLVINLDGADAVVQSLNLEGEKLSITGGNTISFANWDTDASDDFSGDYYDLKNAPELFSRKFNDLIEVPDLYTKNQVDSLVVNLDGGDGVVQSLKLEGKKLSISGGNTISFENWDTDASNDFSGSFKDLTEVPNLYTKNQVDSLVVNLDGGDGVAQSLKLRGKELSISGGNSISFENWDTDASDDFSGDYNDLLNKPDLFNGDYKELSNLPKVYTKKEVDGLIANIETESGTPQTLKLEEQELTITNGNSISFKNWDTDASDDFSGDYDDLKNKPKMYTQDEVDSIKEEILKNVEKNYSKKAEIVSMNSSRKIISTDVGNTIACKVKAPVTLTIPSGFSYMKDGDVINLEVHGGLLTIKGASGVKINGFNKSIIKGNNNVYTGGIIRKINNNSYIVL